MAACISVSSILSSFLPRLSNPALSIASRSTALYTRQITHPLLPRWAVIIPAAIQLNIPDLLGDIWESILRAVPKQKTPHHKKRSRQLAGKALKDKISLNNCPACGHIKRAHYLCPFCVEEIQTMMRGGKPKRSSTNRKDRY